MAGALTCRPMRRPELDLALDWAAAEGWNPGLRDADAFWAADPEGFLLAGGGGGRAVGRLSAGGLGPGLIGRGSWGGRGEDSVGSVFIKKNKKPSTASSLCLP